MYSGLSRREFIRGLGGSFASLILAGRSLSTPSGTPSAFKMLVVGDSLIWGQGLREDQKFYYLTKKWIESEILGGSLPVELKVLAHSGSTVKLDPEERAALEGANRTGFEELHPEINVSFPTIEKQFRTAAEHYADPEQVDLILISGGIPDVGVAKIINPLESNRRLRERIDLYLRGHFREVLLEGARKFPAAKIAVIGYYPIITRHTPIKRIVNDILEFYNWPRWAKPLINNPVKRNLWRLWKGKMIERSRIWHRGSDETFREIINELNTSSGRERAIFVPSPITERQAFGTRESLLFTAGRKGRPDDPKGEIRLQECAPALRGLRNETRLRYRTRFCELASIGHPNPEGSAAIARSIREGLTPLLSDQAK
ncbi:hypothetical protein [Leptolyngbya sp. 7M]|uniref:hypothetical protein n=1 Tax=Leptolyngbya sp. 7M TaxID=2812896 RepID=UPI001B8D807E|nr:hypothetical protein [Leptolyngbya sp. 7M]QYO66007.1 hypothetical protein JVX88_04185 [Leptolyngbya sp. 7M]